jgi:hypothetical protein
MFGTELDTAYYNPTPSPQKPVVEYTPEIPRENPICPPDKVMMYPQIPNEPIFQKNEERIKELQLELEKQKTAVKKDTEPIYDRFVSKKKDVLKLINISITILLAISIHYVLSDLLKNYLQINDFTHNKETFIKLLYPSSVLLVLWSLKVFNK